MLPDDVEFAIAADAIFGDSEVIRDMGVSNRMSAVALCGVSVAFDEAGEFIRIEKRIERIPGLRIIREAVAQRQRSDGLSAGGVP